MACGRLKNSETREPLPNWPVEYGWVIDSLGGKRVQLTANILHRCTALVMASKISRLVLRNGGSMFLRGKANNMVPPYLPFTPVHANSMPVRVAD